ncbi:hypothetical protein E4U53_005157 [Claviceps sorghi]|nr:hypothetical protein E4U53_005157 [Claviceps sorghi]
MTARATTAGELPPATHPKYRHPVVASTPTQPHAKRHMERSSRQTPFQPAGGFGYAQGTDMEAVSAADVDDLAAQGQGRVRHKGRSVQGPRAVDRGCREASSARQGRRADEARRKKIDEPSSTWSRRQNAPSPTVAGKCRSGPGV